METEAVVVDAKRTDVPATLGVWREPEVFMHHRPGREHAEWHGPPGAFIYRGNGPPKAADGPTNDFLLCCPGCGLLAAPVDAARWNAVAGDWADPTTLTLSPSVQRTCCGGHWYLRNGKFESC